MYESSGVQFADRHDAGRALALELEEYRGANAVVLALPRGGVVVGYEIARSLGLPLDVIITRKIGAPGNPEYAIGAVAENGEVVLNQSEIDAMGIPHQYVESETARQREEIERRVQLYRAGKRLPDMKGKTAIIVDDGIATGFTMFAAVNAARAEGPREIVVAVPVAAPASLGTLRPLVDRVVCPVSPTPFWAVGLFYRDFEQVTDDEVRQYLEMSRQERSGPAGDGSNDSS